MPGDPISWRVRTRFVGLLSGPLLALALYHLLPTSFVDASGAEVAFGHAGRATLACMAWTEARGQTGS